MSEDEYTRGYREGWNDAKAHAADRIEVLESLSRINISARDTLLMRVEALEAALRFYAEPKNYSDDYWKGIWKTSAAALAPEQEK